MDRDRRQRLEAPPGWSWTVHSDQWEKGFSHLKEFSQREGHCQVREGVKTDNGYRLGIWVSNQRRAKDTMDSDRRQRLEALPGWSWSPQWEEVFSYLKSFAERQGHCRVSYFYKTKDKYPLGIWVIGSALRRCRVGHGVPNGKKPSLIRKSFQIERGIAECPPTTKPMMGIG